MDVSSKEVSMPTQTDQTSPHQLVSDGRVAQLLAMSKSWVRKERFNRRHGLPHTFNLEPIMIGTAPRYRLSDVLNWIQRTSQAGGER
jgi:predicted DNA-binding transcriptional regulator AlpA